MRSWFILCVLSRLALAALAYSASEDTLRLMAFPALAIALGFSVIYLGGLRRTGLETGGRPIWWDHLRPFHALCYFAFAYWAWTGQRSPAWKALLLDVIVGTAAFLSHHQLL